MHTWIAEGSKGFVNAATLDHHAFKGGKGAVLSARCPLKEKTRALPTPHSRL